MRDPDYRTAKAVGGLKDRANWSLIMNKTELSVSQLLEDRVCLEVESIDRMYLNVYVPGLQRELGMVSYIKYHLSQPVPSTVVVADQSRAFVKAIRRFVEDEGIPLVRFKKGQRKEGLVFLLYRRSLGGSTENTRLIRTKGIGHFGLDYGRVLLMLWWSWCLPIFHKISRDFILQFGIRRCGWP